MVSISFTQHQKDYDTMDYELEKHLREMGILPQTELEALSDMFDVRCTHLAKGYFNDPRDPITGEVPY